MPRRYWHFSKNFALLEEVRAPLLTNEERGFAVHMPYILRIGPDTLVPSDGKV